MPQVVLHYDEIGREQPFHVSKLTLPRDSGWKTDAHGHDFHEFLFVAGGSLTHQVNDQIQLLAKGSLALVRSRDFHNLTPISGSGVEFFNVAVPIDIWSEFCTVTGIEEESRHWMGEAMPPTVTVNARDFDLAYDAFETILIQFFDRPNRFAFGAFWQSVIPNFLQRNVDTDALEVAPEWLRSACEWAGHAPNVDLDLKRFAEQSSVSLPHLCRSMKRFMGVTPTEYINTIRLKRAALMLATTSHEVIDIALECGFENLSYFYRRFRTAYHKTPRDYRYTMRQSVPPG